VTPKKPQRAVPGKTLPRSVFTPPRLGAPAPRAAPQAQAGRSGRPTPPRAGAAGPSSQRESEVVMEKKQILLKALETDARDAGLRLAGSQFVKIAREPIVAFLSRQLGQDDESLRGKIAAFLDSELGEAMLAGVLSLGLSMLPAQTGNVPVHLARELRVRAMGQAGDVIADLLMGPLREVMTLYLQGIPNEATPALPAEREGLVRPPVSESTEEEAAERRPGVVSMTR
jgi:hypothetical protein